MTGLQEIWTAYCALPGEAAFAPLYERTKPLVFTICWRMLGNMEDAADAFQGAYGRLLALARDPHAAREVQDVSATVARLAAREADALRKRRSRRGKKEIPMQYLPETGDGLETADKALARRERRERVEALVAELPEELRLPVQLHFFHGMSRPQIAATLETPVSTVTHRIKRALERLEPRLRKAGLGETATVLGVLAAGGLLAPPAAWSAAAIYASATAVAVGAAGGAGTGAAIKGALAAFKVKAAAGIAAALLTVSAVVMLMQGSRPTGPITTRPRPPERAVEVASTPLTGTTVAAASSPARTPEPRPTPPPTQTVALRMLWQDSGQPIAATTVTLRRHYDWNEYGKERIGGSTDGEGRIRATLPAGWLKAAAHVEDRFAAQWSPFDVPTSGTREVRVPRGGLVVGKVFENNSRPVAGAVVGVLNGDTTATTRADGSFELTGLWGGGSYRPFAVKGDLCSYRDADEVERVRVAAGRENGPVFLILQQAEGLVGRVTDAATGGVLAGATVAAEIEGQRTVRAVSDENGAYRLAALPSGHWKVKAAAAGRATAVKLIQVGPGLANRCDFALAAGGAVDVLVVDRQGNPVGDARVRVELNRDIRTVEMAQARSGADGRARIDGLDVQEAYTVAAHAPERGFNSCQADRAAFAPGRTLTQARVIVGPSEPDRADSQSKRGRSVFVGVISGPDGKPVAEATVAWGDAGIERGGRTVTDSQGNYRLVEQMPGDPGFGASSPVDPRRAALSAWAEGFGVTRAFSPELGTEAAPARIDMALTPGHWLELDVVDDADKPVEGARLNVYQIRGDRWYGLPKAIRDRNTDAAGFARLDGLPEGEVVFDLSKDGMTQVDDERLAVNQRKRISMPGLGVLRGVVTDSADGSPVTAYSLKVTKGASVSEELRMLGLAVQNPEGSFELPNIQRRGNYTLRVEAEGYSPVVREDIDPLTATDKGPGVEIKLSRTKKLEGIVVDAATGEPLSDVQLTNADRGERLSSTILVDWATPGGDPVHSGERSMAVTRADGGFSLTELNPESSVMLLQGAGRERMVLLPGELQGLKDGPDRLRIPMKRGGVIAGVYKESGEPRANAAMLLNLPSITKASTSHIAQTDLKGQTGAEGRFRFDGLAPGSYSITVGSRSWSVELAEGEEKTLELDAKSQGDGTLSGRVLAGTEPLAGVQVSLSRWIIQDIRGSGNVNDGLPRNFETTSDAQGGYRFENLPSGTYALSSWRQRAETGMQQVRIERLKIDGPVAQDLVFKGEHRVTARLAFPEGTSGEERQRWLRFQFNPRGHHSTFDNPDQLDSIAHGEIAGGKLEFGGRYKGQYKLQLLYREADGSQRFIPLERTFELDNLNADQDLGEIELPKRGDASLTGLVADDKGAPLTGANVQAKLGERTFSGQTDANGAYRIEGLRPGEYEVSVASNSTGNRPHYESRKTVRVDGETENNFVTLPYYRLKGRLTGPAVVVQSIHSCYIFNPRQKALDASNPLQLGDVRVASGTRGLSGGGRFEFEGRYLGDYQILLHTSVDGIQRSIAIPVRLDNLEHDQDLGEVPLPAMGQLNVALHWDPAPPTLPTPPPGAPARVRSELGLILFQNGDLSRQSHWPLEPAEGTQTIDNVPPGIYDAVIYTRAYASEPARVRIEVKSGEAPPTLAITLRARGVIMGQVDHSLRMQQDFQFSRVTVRGPLGVPDSEIRVIVPPKEPVGETELFLSGRDFIRRGVFMAVGLKAGQYDVTLEADGYQPVTARQTVVPGQPTPMEPIKMEPAGK